jgi:SAM-dependent methyltransferase
MFRQVRSEAPHLPYLERLSMTAHDEIQIFYDRHPYPPPVADLDRYRQLWKHGDRLRVDHHLLWPPMAYREDLDVLVAGCGTSQAARHAIRQPTARVTGIDVSATGLDHTRKLKREYNLANLEIRQLPIERVGELGRTFDKIICTGVLHHLSDPEIGLRALRTVLEPDGAMVVMVYAAYGRTGIYMLQAYCRRLGIGATEREIQDLLSVLKELPRGHPLDHLLRGSPDFRQADALADALLNPRDRAYTVPQLFDLIERCGLAFGRWYRQAPYLPQCGVIATTPHGSRLAQLTAQEQYAALELFRGTISRHSFSVYRDDRSAAPQPIRFDDEAWRDYVPIRQPGVVCVKERLPPGAAAVLINQEHLDTDLIHPINSDEKSLFEAIDGDRTIGEMMEDLPVSEDNPQRRERVRDFFERLWWYDHVVFDASKAAAEGQGNKTRWTKDDRQSTNDG